MNQKSQLQRTPNQRIWQRLKRNKPALWGLCWIGLSILIAVFGYWLTPDATPFANDQVSEIRDKGLGFSIEMLKVQKNRIFESQSIFTTMLYGQENTYTMIPIVGHNFKGDSIYVKIYQGEGE